MYLKLKTIACIQIEPRRRGLSDESNSVFIGKKKSLYAVIYALFF